MKVVTALVVLLVYLTPNANAQTHLIPEALPFGGILLDYEMVLADVFRYDGYPGSILTRMIIRPKYDPEWLSGIRRSQDGYEAYSVRPNENIWYFGWRNALNEDPVQEWDAMSVRELEIERHSAAIDSETAYLLREIWRRVVLDARHPNIHPYRSPVLCTGATAIFAIWIVDYGKFSARARCVGIHPFLRELVNLGVLVGEFARGELSTTEEIRTQGEQVLDSLAE